MSILSQPERKPSATQPLRAQNARRALNAGRAQPRPAKPGPEPARRLNAAPAAAPAKNKGLGRLLLRSNARPLSWGGLLRLSLLGCLAVLGPLAYGLWQGQVIQAERGIVAAQAASEDWYGVALAALVIFSLLVIVRLRARRGFVAIHENGVAIRQTWGKVRILGWSAIAGLASEQSEQYFLGWRLGLRYQATLIPTTGKPMHLPAGLEKTPELISQLKACLYPRLLPGLEASLQAGKNLYFGPLSISPHGLVSGSQRWSWAEVQYFDIQNGWLEIKGPPRGALRFAAGAIPNLELLLQLVPQCAPERAAV